MKTLVLALLLLYVALVALAYLLADRLIFLPPASSYSRASLPVTLVTGPDDARIAILHLRNPHARFTLIHSHGNAEDLGHTAGLLEGFRTAGFSVIGYDYRGYGLSTGGPPTAKGASSDLRTVYLHATRQLGIPPTEIILLGRSVGSGPAVELAASEPVAGLIVESAFVSAFRVVTRVPLIPLDPFPNLRRIRHISAPLLVIHGLADEVVPVSHGRKLFGAAPEPKRALWVEGARHNDLVLVAGRRYWEAILDFADSIRHPPESAGGGAPAADGSAGQPRPHTRINDDAN
jgi:abhydrolase domain-containing protein 17